MFQLYIFEMNLFSSDVSHERASKGGFNQKKMGGTEITDGLQWKNLFSRHIWTDVEEIKAN